MIIPFLVSSKWRTKVRHKLIFGLGISDLSVGESRTPQISPPKVVLTPSLPALCLLIPSSTSLAGSRLKAGSAPCVAGASIYTASVLTSSFWALGIAIVTFSILVRPLARLTTLLTRDSAFYIYFASIWIFSGTIAAIGAGIYHRSITDVGGWCSYAGPGKLFGQLALFIPRAAAFTITIVLYVRLVFFFRRKESFAVLSDPHGHLDAGLARFYSRNADIDGGGDDGWDPSRVYGSPTDSATSKPWYSRRPSSRRQSTEKSFVDMLPVLSPRRWSYPRRMSADNAFLTTSTSPTRNRKASKDSGSTTLFDDNLRMSALGGRKGSLSPPSSAGSGASPAPEKLAMRRSTIAVSMASMQQPLTVPAPVQGGVPWATEVRWGPPASGLAARREASRQSATGQQTPAASDAQTSQTPGLKITAPSSPAWVQGAWHDTGMISPKNVPARPALATVETDTSANSRKILMSSGSSRGSSDSDKRSSDDAGSSAVSNEETIVADPPTPAVTSAAEEFPFLGGQQSTTSDLDDLPLASSRSVPFPTSNSLHQMLPSLEEVDTPPGSPETGVLDRPRLTAPVIPNDFLSPSGPRPFTAMAKDFNPPTSTDRRRSSTAMKAIAGLAASIGAGAGAGGASGSRRPSEPEASWQAGSGEEKQRLSNQEMNRKASMLMLLYPLAVSPQIHWALSADKADELPLVSPPLLGLCRPDHHRARPWRTRRPGPERAE